MRTSIQGLQQWTTPLPPKKNNEIIFQYWLRTGSNPPDINRLRSNIGNNILPIDNVLYFDLISL